jgi:hypothetical protein
LIFENRLHLLLDIQDWADYLLYHGYNFSCGSRIHGNILPILCGIPSAICPLDMRVKEMAEYFEIPMIEKKKLLTENLWEIYNNVSYERFNNTFASKYEYYINFLVERGILRANEKPNCLLKLDSNPNVERIMKIDTMTRSVGNSNIIKTINKLYPVLTGVEHMKHKATAALVTARKE